MRQTVTKLDRFAEWERNYKQALKDIETYRRAEATQTIAEWLLTTPASPYEFLPAGWGNALSSPGETSGLLAVIHHALVDDGEIEFVSVNGMPRIVFCNQHEDNFREVALTQEEQQKANVELTVLDCTADEFGELVDAAATAQHKRCFAMDAAIHGVEFAVKHYVGSCWYDPSWIEELQPEIERRKKFYSDVQ